MKNTTIGSPSSVAAADPAANKRNLILSLIPVLVPVAFCVFAVAQRAVTAVLPGAAYGQTSSRQVRQLAGALCQQISGAAANPVETSQQTAFSQRTGRVVREWSVLCDTARASYLVRINADTGRVFGVNRMDTAEGEATKGALLSRTKAESYARRYLNLIGAPAQAVETYPGHTAAARRGARDTWCFNYRLKTKRAPGRILSVCVNGRSGALVYAWNPALAL